MREGIGSIALYNIIIIFIVVTFAVLAGTMSYSKAFKTNNRIINAIEKYEGYTNFAAEEIDSVLMSIGYLRNGAVSCPKKKGVEALDNLNPNYHFCVYQFGEETREWNGRYSTYGVITYINIDLPVVGDLIKVPVYGQSKMVFSFDKENPPAPSVEAVGLFYDLTDLAYKDYFDKDLEILSFKKNSRSVDFDKILNVWLRYSDDNTLKLPIGRYEITDFDTTTSGRKEMYIFYKDFIVQISYIVKD